MHRKTAAPTKPLSTTGRPRCRRPGRSEDGAIAIMAALVVIVMMAFFGIALDLSRAYNRKAELQTAADAIALAAANALDGTSDGLDNAMAAAVSAADLFTFSYGHGTFAFSPEALKFGTAPDGGPAGWVAGGTAKPDAQKVFFARVDTSVLDSSHGLIENVLMPVLSPSFATTSVDAQSVAGRDTVNALPLAICANSNTPATGSPAGELVEFGFRRGISYDLMKLNPAGGSAENFLINPISPPGTVGISMMGRMDVVSVYVCTGKMAIPGLLGKDGVTVERGFPINKLYPHLNTRFGTYEDPCNSSGAPTDPNTKSYDLASATWIKSQPPNLSVGPLWSYTKAAKYASYLASKGVEPPLGYGTYSASTLDWATLYPGPPAAQPQSYPPSQTPYMAGNGVAYKTGANTRVLRVPLLQCPVDAGSKVTAIVLGVGRFFMTVPATASTLHAEFAGAEPWTAVGGNARLYK